jgi:two-component system CheB/CheR fusion protein
MLRQQTELLNQAHEPILMWELDGSITYWNRAAEQAYGYTREQALGRKTHELLLTTPDREVFAGALEEQGAWTGKFEKTARNGQKVSVESRMVVVQEADGRRLVLEIDSR